MDTSGSVVSTSTSTIDSVDKVSTVSATSFTEKHPSGPSDHQLDVKSLRVNGGTGMLNGVLTNYTVNHFIVPTGNGDAFNPKVVKDIVTDAVRELSIDGSSLYEDPSGCAIRLRGCKNLPYKKKFWFTATLTVAVAFLVIFSLLYFLVFNLADSTNSANSLKLVTRAEWGAGNPTGKLEPNTLPLYGVIVSHTVTPECNTSFTCSASVRTMQVNAQYGQYPVFDIPYNFMIGGDGAVYEGRGWEMMGAHTRGHNNGTLGVGFIGTYTSQVPSPAMVSAFNQLVELGVQIVKVQPNYTLVGQCQVKNTSSPGLALIDNMKTWRHFDSTLNGYC